MMDSEQVHTPLDTCRFVIENFYNESMKIFTQVDTCAECPLIFQKIVEPNNTIELLLTTKHSQIIKIKDEESITNCEFDYHTYQDQATYKLDLFAENVTSQFLRNSNCTIDIIRQGRRNEFPLIILGSLILSALCFSLMRNFFKTYFRQRRQSDLIETALDRLDSTIKHSNDLNSSRPKRCISVDVFRGFVILMMIFVNYGAGGYTFLEHSPWFGLTVADIIFPAFLFLMGTSIGFSFKNLVSRQENLDFNKIYLKILRRSFILFVFGLIVNSIGQNDLRKLRVPGVLQRFAICYLIMAFLHLNSLLNSINESKYLRLLYKFYFADIYPFYREWLFMIVSTIVYLYFTLFFNYDDKCQTGYQGPGGLHMNKSQFNCTGGAARKIDIWLFGNSHIYPWSTSKIVFQNTQNHDPEGLLGTIGSLLVVFFGLQVAKIQYSFTSNRMKLTRFFIYTVALSALGLILHFTNCIPICKNLWSLSFVFVTSSICFLIFTCLYIIIEIKSYWHGQPFKDTGKNALFLYLGHEICGGMFPFYYQVDDSSHYLLLLRCSIATFVWLLIAIYMGRKKVFIKI